MDGGGVSPPSWQITPGVTPAKSFLGGDTGLIFLGYAGGEDGLIFLGYAGEDAGYIFFRRGGRLDRSWAGSIPG